MHIERHFFNKSRPDIEETFSAISGTDGGSDGNESDATIEEVHYDRSMEIILELIGTQLEFWMLPHIIT